MEKLCIICRGWFLLFYCPPHAVYVHINFPTPCSADSALLLLLLLFLYLYVHPHVPSILFSLHAHVSVLVSWKNFPLDIFQHCMGFSLPSTEHVENIINFISYAFTLLNSALAAHILLPANFELTLKYHLFDTHRNESKIKEEQNKNKESRKSFFFSIFWHFPKAKFCNVVSVEWVEKSFSLKLNNHTNTDRWQTIGILYLYTIVLCANFHHRDVMKILPWNQFCCVWWLLCTFDVWLSLEFLLLKILSKIIQD